MPARQAFLHVPDLAHGDGEALGNRGALALLPDDVVGGFLHRRNRRHAAVLQLQYAGRQGRPEQGGEKERGRHRLALLDAQVGIGQRVADQRAGILGVALQRGGAGGEQRRKQVVFEQQLEGPLAAEEQLERLVEQAGRGDAVEQLGQVGDGPALWRSISKSSLAAKRTARSMRTGLVALLGIADQANQAIADVVHAAGVVEDALAGRVVVQRIDGEVPALGVVLERAIDVVAQDAPLSLREANWLASSSSSSGWLARKVATSMISRPKCTGRA